MELLLNFIGVLLILASIILSCLLENYVFFMFPSTFALGILCIGLGKIIHILYEIRDKDIK